VSTVPLILHGNRKPTRFVALIDESDAALVSQRRWSIFEPRGSRTKYARSSVNGQVIYLHRFIMRKELEQATRETEVDHIDGDGLNNTRSNLRLTTHAANIGAAHHRQPYRLRPATHIHTVKVKLANGDMRTYRYLRRSRRTSGQPNV
jgi:hypothetical protein